MTSAEFITVSESILTTVAVEEEEEEEKNESGMSD
jgi:hypothetical protein